MTTAQLKEHLLSVIQCARFSSNAAQPPHHHQLPERDSEHMQDTHPLTTVPLKRCHYFCHRRTASRALIRLNRSVWDK